MKYGRREVMQANLETAPLLAGPTTNDCLRLVASGRWTTAALPNAPFQACSPFSIGVHMPRAIPLPILHRPEMEGFMTRAIGTTKSLVRAVVGIGLIGIVFVGP